MGKEYKHTTREGAKIPITDLETEHLFHIIAWIKKKAKEGFTTHFGGSCPGTAEGMWYDTQTIYGKKVKQELNYKEYKRELKRRETKRIRDRKHRFVKIYLGIKGDIFPNIMGFNFNAEEYAEICELICRKISFFDDNPIMQKRYFDYFRRVIQTRKGQKYFIRDLNYNNIAWKRNY